MHKSTDMKQLDLKTTHSKVFLDNFCIVQQQLLV